MTQKSLVFPAGEYQERTARLQARMALKGIDALLLTSAADVFYTTGFLTRFWESPARPWFVVVPAAGNPSAVIPSIGVDLMQKTWIEDIRHWQAPDPYDDGLSLLAETLSEICPPNGRIGVPMGLETQLRMPLGDFFRLQSTLAPRQFRDATSIIQRVREIKSPLEVEKIKTAANIAGRAFDRVPKFAKEGRPLDTVFRAFQMALLEEGADWVSYTAGGASPDGYADVISPAGPVPLTSGDILMLDTGAVSDGYFCDFDRNYAVGKLSDEARRVHEALWTATEIAIETLRPGHSAADAHRILREALEKEQVEVGSGRLGHGLGLTLTEWPSFTPLDYTLLRDGMVLTLEPSAKVRDGVYIVHEENILLTENGVELLSPRASFEMTVI